MRSRPLLILIGTMLLAFLFAPVRVAGAQEPATLYRLDPTSTFNTGCFGPCACPIITPSALEGTFMLRRTSVDPLFTTYDVSNVRWSLPDMPTPVQITGTGTYRVGGEVAVQHQLTLDLSFDSGAPVHFDSGLITGGGDFPAINIRVSIHQDTACRDTMLDLKSKPAVTTSADGGHGRPHSTISVGNPFRAGTDVRVDLVQAGRTTIDIFDAQGRLIRRLQPQKFELAGRSIVHWDGTSDRGIPVSAGIYLFRVQTDEGTLTCRAAKLK